MAYEYKVVEGVGGDWHIYAIHETGCKLIGTRTDKAEAYELALNCANSSLLMWHNEAVAYWAQREADLAVL